MSLGTGGGGLAAAVGAARVWEGSRKSNSPTSSYEKTKLAEYPIVVRNSCGKAGAWSGGGVLAVPNFSFFEI